MGGYTGIKGKFYNSTISLYNNSMSCVKVGANFTDWFKVDRGLRQGCNLSPALFNLFSNDLANIPSTDPTVAFNVQ